MPEETKKFMQKKLSTDRDWKLKIIAAKRRLNQQETLDALVDDAYGKLDDEDQGN